MARLILVLIFAVTGVTAGELKLVQKDEITNVDFVTTNQIVRLTNFRNPHHIYQASLSPNEKFALIWHMDFPPRKIMVIDVATQKVLTDFSPCVAGTLEWSADDRIIHRYGFGTGHYAAIYTPTGNNLFQDVSGELFETCDVDADPSKKAVVFIPSSHAGQITLVRTLDGALYKLGPKGIICSFWSWQDKKLQINYTTNNIEDIPEQHLILSLPEEWLDHKI